MTKKIAVINDLSGFGRCSLTAAISAISVMGVQPCPLPTAILSAQTGYPSYYCDDYTDKMEYFRREWEKMEVRFDGIYTGFVASEAQIGQIFRFLDTFYREPAFLLVDPVMGDQGKVYKFFTPGLLEQMKELALRADVVTPNLTELCLLTGADLAETGALKEKHQLINTAEELAEKLIRSGPHTVIVTGIRFEDACGRRMIGNLAVTEQAAVIGSDPSAAGQAAVIGGDPSLPEQAGNAAGNRITCEKGGRLSAFPYIGGSFSGTGDLFASVMAGGIARGDDLFRLMDLAGEFIEKAMKDSMEARVERNAGTNYEKYLKMLVPR